MAKFLIEATYTAEGLKGLHKDGAAGRLKAVRASVEALGGKLEHWYLSLGERDVIGIVDLPDTISAAAYALAISETGLLHTKTTALLSAEETDRALHMVVKYRGPGKAG